MPCVQLESAKQVLDSRRTAGRLLLSVLHILEDHSVGAVVGLGFIGSTWMFVWVVSDAI